MENPRRLGGLLLVAAFLVFAGISGELLTAQLFPLGLVMFPIGLLLFMKGNRAALERADERAREAVRPRIGSVTADAFADRQAQALARSGGGAATGRPPSASSEAEAGSLAVERDEISLEVDADAGQFEVSTDVSFPSETEARPDVALQIRELQRLLEDGIIDAEEFSVAKAKILS